MFSIFKSIWPVIVKFFCTVFSFLVISKSEPRKTQQLVSNPPKKQQQTKKQKQKGKQPKFEQESEAPLKKPIEQRTQPHSVSSLIPELSSQSPDSSVESYSADKKKQMIVQEKPKKQSPLSTKKLQKLKNPIVKQKLQKYQNLSSVAQSIDEDDSWVQIQQKKHTQNLQEEIRQIEEKTKERQFSKQVQSSVDSKFVSKVEEERQINIQSEQQQKVLPQEKPERREVKSMIIKPQTRVEIEESYTPRIVEAIKIIPQLSRPQDVQFFSTPALPDVNTDGKQFFGKFKRLTNMQIQRKVQQVEQQQNLPTHDETLEEVQTINDVKKNVVKERQPLSIEIEEKMLQFIRDSIKAQYTIGRNNENILTFETLISIFDAAADLLKNKYSEYIIFKRKERRELLKNKDYENYAHFVVQMSIEVEDMLHQAQETVSQILNIDHHVYEISFLHYMNPEGESDDPITQEEQEIQDLLTERLQSIHQELKLCIRTTIDLSMNQGVEIIEYQIQIVRNFKENEFFKEITPHLDHSEDHQQLMPTVLGYVLEDIIYEKFKCEEEDKLKFIKANFDQDIIKKLLVELDEVSQIFENIDEDVQ